MTALITSYALIINPNFGILTPETLSEGKWWSVLLYAFRYVSPNEISGNGFWTWFSLGIHSYILLVVGRIMEELLGSPKFNLYLWSTILHITIGGLLSVYYPLFVDTRQIYLALIIAISILIPNSELFIIPVKMKWIGGLVAIYCVGTAVGQVKITGTYLPLLGLYFGFANLIYFFAKDAFGSVRRRSKRTVWVAKQAEVFTMHRCHTCGATEHTDPSLEFRYCVDCDDLEYCEKHLHDHIHVKSAK